MGSFDKSYYDILNRYQGILKEGMGVQPIVYKKTGNTYVPANELDMKIVPPQMLFTKSDDPAAPFVPYEPANATNPTPTTVPATNMSAQPAQTNTQATNQPSISVTGNSTPQTSVAIPSIGGQRIQYPSSVSTSAPTQSTSSTPTSKSTTSPVKSVPPSRPGSPQNTTNIKKRSPQQGYRHQG